MNNNILTFGIHKGRTHEWLFFNDPQYALWIKNERIHKKDWYFAEEDGCHFSELMARATSLANMWQLCQDESISRCAIDRSFKYGRVIDALFVCDNCEYPYSRTSSQHYYPASMFAGWYRNTKADRKKVIEAVKRHYLGCEGPLSQKQMEKFFSTDGNFSNGIFEFFVQENLIV